MNILFVHEVDWLKKVVFEIYNLSELLALSGHRVYAIDYESMWTKNGFFDFGNLRPKVLNGVARAYPGASVSLLRPGFIKIPGLSRISAAFTHYLEIQKIIKDKNIDVIMLYSVPTNGLQTIHLAKKFNIPVVFRSIDISHQLVPYPVLRPITKFLEKEVYSNADLILTRSPTLSDYVIRTGARDNKVRLLLPGVDTHLFRPSVDSTEIRQKWQIKEGEHIIVFVGTLFEFRGLDTFLYRFPEVIKQIPEAKLLIVGDGPLRPKLEGIIAELGLRRQVIITGFEPYATMVQYINLATICIDPFPITEATREIIPGMVPGKIFQYLACGKGVVSTPLPGITALLPSESHGIVYASNADDMAIKLIFLLNSAEHRQQLGEGGLNYVRQVHSYEKIARQLETILEEAIKEKHNGAISKRA